MQMIQEIRVTKDGLANCSIRFEYLFPWPLYPMLNLGPVKKEFEYQELHYVLEVS